MSVRYDSIIRRFGGSFSAKDKYLRPHVAQLVLNLGVGIFQE